MTRVTELTPLLKRLQLGPMAATLPERIALARREQLDYASFLEIILSDEINRRADRLMELRLLGAGFEETCRLEDFGLVPRRYPGPKAPGRRLLSPSSSSGMSMCCWWDPPAWARPSWPRLWGYTAIRAGYTVRFCHADDFFRALLDTAGQHFEASVAELREWLKGSERALLAAGDAGD